MNGFCENSVVESVEYLNLGRGDQVRTRRRSGGWHKKAQFGCGARLNLQGFGGGSGQSGLVSKWYYHQAQNKQSFSLISRASCCLSLTSVEET